MAIKAILAGKQLNSTFDIIYSSAEAMNMVSESNITKRSCQAKGNHGNLPPKLRMVSMFSK